MDVPELVVAREYLEADRLDEAKSALEAFLATDPKSSIAQGLLAKTFMKMNDGARAVELYEQLVYDNPADPPLRLNLGSAYLKESRFAEAVNQFQIVLDFEPDHKKAQGLLGAALAKLGNYEEAQTLFIRCGNMKMAEMMEKAIRQKTSAPPSEASPSSPPQAPKADQNPAPVVEETEKEASSTPSGDEASSASAINVQAANDVTSSNAHSEGAHGATIKNGAADSRDDISKTSRASDFFGKDDVVSFSTSYQLEQPSEKFQKVSGNTRFNSELFEFTRTKLPTNKRHPSLVPLENAPTPYRIDKLVEIFIDKEINTRINGLMISTGDLSFIPLEKSANLSQTHHHGREQMLTVLGKGSLSISPSGRTFVSIQLRQELAYFQSDCVYSFESTLSFERNSLPIGNNRNMMEFAYMKGTGNILLALPGPLYTRTINNDVCQMPRECIVGWKGRLLPQPPTFPESFQYIADELELIEIRGTGTVLFTHDAMK